MSEILSADELEPARQFVGFVKRNGGTQGAQRNSAADLIERLLVSHEALSRRLAEVEAERDALERSRPVWLRADPIAAEAHVAEMVAALREADAWLDSRNVGRTSGVRQIIAAVLDKGEHE